MKKELTNVEILQKVQNSIVEDLHIVLYICPLISRVTEVEIHPLRKWIESMLSGHYTLEGWLRSKGLDTHTLTTHETQTIRLRWLDWMIAECKKEDK